MKRILYLFAFIFVIISLSGCNHVHKSGDWEIITEPTCEEYGERVLKCSKCSEVIKTEDIEPLGHEYSSDADEHIYYSLCLHNCGTFKNGQDTSFLEKFNTTYNKEGYFNKESVMSIYNDLMGKARSLEKYNKELHYYVKDSELDKLYKQIEDTANYLYGEVFDYLSAEMKVYSILLDVDPTDENLTFYNEIIELRNLINDSFSELNIIGYESCLREYYYLASDGWTEEKILEHIKVDDSTSVLDEQAGKISQLSQQITSSDLDDVLNDAFFNTLTEYISLSNDYISNINELYGTNLNNYFDYCYIYGFNRDYLINDFDPIMDDIKVVAKDVTRYCESLYADIQSKLQTLNQEETLLLTTLSNASFSNNAYLVRLIGEYYEYLQSMNDNPYIDYVYEYENLLQNHYYIYTDSYRAFNTSIDGSRFIKLGPDYYSTLQTTIHELGHYMYSAYRNNNKIRGTQSYDILEVHSIGNEKMFINYLKEKYNDPIFDIYISQLYLAHYRNLFGTFVSSILENQMFKAENEGTSYSYEDCKELYTQLLKDFGLESLYNADEWIYSFRQRTGYCISYFISYILSSSFDYEYNLKGFDKMVELYNQFIMYQIEGNTSIKMQQWLEYYQLDSPFDINTYNNIKDFFINELLNHSDNSNIDE